MTPADRRELCAILRRVRAYVQGVEDDATNAQIDAMKAGRSLDGEINHIESEEPCPTTEPNLSGASADTRSTSNASGACASADAMPAGTNTTPSSPGPKAPSTGDAVIPSAMASPSRGGDCGATGDAAVTNLAAIRQAVERLRDVRGDPTEFAPDASEVEDAVDALLALDVPAVVAALMDEAKGERYVAGCERADRLDAEARADLAEGKCVRLERDLTEAKEQRDDALIRAEKAETDLAVLREAYPASETTDWVQAILTLHASRDKARQERDAARKERDEAKRKHDELQRGVFKMENAEGITYRGLTLQQLQDRCKAFETNGFDIIEARYLREIQEARDKALEEAAVYLDTLKMYGTQATLADAIRAMKGKK